MDNFLIIVALLSMGLGLGLVFCISWEIIRKIFSIKSRREFDVVIIAALLSAIASRFICQINGLIIYNIIVAIGAMIVSVVFMRLIK
jgi:hypothetical protein